MRARSGLDANAMAKRNPVWACSTRHALKHSHAGRYHKDLLDVEGLVRANAVDLRSDGMRHIFLKYGSEKIYEQISRFTAGEQP
jgi:hypothetical protein